jgi:dienelactone hydrolase
MNASSIGWRMIACGGTRHSLTTPDADERGGAALAYSPSADRRSWQHMTYFFDELFAGV